MDAWVLLLHQRIGSLIYRDIIGCSAELALHTPDPAPACPGRYLSTECVLMFTATRLLVLFTQGQRSGAEVSLFVYLCVRLLFIITE